MVHERIPRGVPSRRPRKSPARKMREAAERVEPQPVIPRPPAGTQGAPTLHHHDRDAAAPKLTGRRDTRGTAPDDDCAADLGHDYPSLINPSRRVNGPTRPTSRYRHGGRTDSAHGRATCAMDEFRSMQFPPPPPLTADAAVSVPHSCC